MGELLQINQGIVTGCNKISKKHLETYIDNDWYLNQGIFVLSDEDISVLNVNDEEERLLKPWYKSSNIHRWITDEQTDEKLIYYATKKQYENVDKLKSYLDKFKRILINRNVRTGSVTEAQYDDFIHGKINIPYVMIASEMKNNNYFCVSYARTEEIFISPKIVVPQRSSRNTFAYNDIPWFGATDVYFITEGEKPCNLKYVVALLNSKLYYCWLYNRGKRKGNTLELFLKPLSEIPIKIGDSNFQRRLTQIVEQIIIIKKKHYSSDISALESEIDKMVYELYSLTQEDIKIVEDSIK